MKFQFYFLLLLTILPLIGCEKDNKSNTQLNYKSYINDFELIQDNKSNDRRIKITSPQAIIDSTNNDIEIFQSSIEILNKNGQDFQVKSGNSILNNLSNYIKVFNNVDISFIDKDDYFINTNSFDWNLRTSIIDIDNPLNINFADTNIVATNGIYNIDSSLLKIDNTEFNRNVYNSEGKEEYKIKIKSDFAKWFMNKNTLEFTSNDKQVETIIDILIIK